MKKPIKKTATDRRQITARPNAAHCTATDDRTKKKRGGEEEEGEKAVNGKNTIKV